MSVKLLTEHHLEFLGYNGGCTGSLSLHLSKYHIVGNHVSRLICKLYNDTRKEILYSHLLATIHRMACKSHIDKIYTVKPVLSGHSKRRPKIGFQDRLWINAGQKYCRMLRVLSTLIKLLFVFKAFVLSIFEWPLKTGFTVPLNQVRF